MRTFIILFFLLFCFTISMSGQKNTLSLDIEAGGLESAIDQEQWLKVHELTLTGSMNDADFYFIRDRLRTLEKLDMKNVQVDTIPVKAIYNHLRIRKIILPKEVKYIGDSAVHAPYITLTGAFPALGTNSLDGSVIPSDDNEYCKLIDDLVCSSDGKILYFVGSYPYLIMPEGIEHIVSKAFESSPIYQVTFPTTLKSIEENAFANVWVDGLANYPYYEDNLFIFNSSTPPELQGDVFTDKVFSCFKLVVPGKESVEMYKKSNPQWSNFAEGIIHPAYISSPLNRKLSILKNDNVWFLRSEYSMVQVEVFTLTGVLLYACYCNDSEVVLDNRYLEPISVLKVIYKNGKTETLKITR